MSQSTEVIIVVTCILLIHVSEHGGHHSSHMLVCELLIHVSEHRSCHSSHMHVLGCGLLFHVSLVPRLLPDFYLAALEAKAAR